MSYLFLEAVRIAFYFETKNFNVKEIVYNGVQRTSENSLNLNFISIIFES